MGKSCCGGGCGRGHENQPDQRCCPGAGVVIAVALVLLLSIGAAVAFASGDKQPVRAPARPAPASATPAAPPVDPARPAKKGYNAETDGVIRYGRTAALAKPPGAIRIATYNIENFFDKESPAGEGGSTTPAKPEAHRKAIAAVIHAMNADVLALEEVESKDTIAAFRDAYLADMGYAHITSIDAGDPRGIEQSILSRFPIKDEQNWPGVPLAGVHPDKLGKKPNPDAGKPLLLKRSPLRATVVVPADAPNAAPTEIAMFVVHHKSGPYYSYLREAEGAKVLEFVRDYEKEHPGVPAIVLGGFNARATEKSITIYTSGGMIDAMSGVSPGAGGVESQPFMSHVSGRTIDHILVNAPAAAMVALDTRFVLGTPQRPENVDWRNTDPPSGYASDHLPVVIDLLPRDIPESGVKRGVTVTVLPAASSDAGKPAASDGK